jgi:DNA-binding transcriptional regulator YhcF (GntR family)
MITCNAYFAKVPARAVRCRVSAIDWQVLHAVALHADTDGRAFPSMARIAVIAGINRSNVPRAIGRLEQSGLMVRNRTRKPQWRVASQPLPASVRTDRECHQWDDTPDEVLSADMTDAAVRWLMNRQPQRWRERKEVEISARLSTRSPC